MNQKVFIFLLIIIIGLASIFMVFHKDKSVVPDKFEVNGWYIVAPNGWDIWKEDSLECVLMAPSRINYHADSNSQAVSIYYNSRPWPHSNLEAALEEVKNTAKASEVEIVELAKKKWLISKSIIGNQDRYFARTIAGVEFP